MPRNPSKPVIIPSDHTTAERPSSFPQSSRGGTTWHTLISSSSPQTPNDAALSAGIAVCPANSCLALHRHAQAELYYILAGSGAVEIDGERHAVGKDATVWIPGDAEHGVFCGEDDELRWLYVFPEGRFEDVVYRFSGEAGEDEDETVK